MLKLIYLNYSTNTCSHVYSYTVSLHLHIQRIIIMTMNMYLRYVLKLLANVY